MEPAQIKCKRLGVGVILIVAHGTFDEHTGRPVQSIDHTIQRCETDLPPVREMDIYCGAIALDAVAPPQ